MVKGWAKFFPSLINFSAASTSHFHFSTHHLAASSSLLPDHGMPAWDLLPPAAALLGEATWYFEYSLPLPPKYAPSLEQIDAYLKGWQSNQNNHQYFSSIYLLYLSSPLQTFANFPFFHLLLLHCLHPPQIPSHIIHSFRPVLSKQATSSVLLFLSFFFLFSNGHLSLFVSL